MRQSPLLISIAVIANLVTIILYKNATNQPGGTGAGLAFAVIWMPVIWLITAIVAGSFTIVNRKNIFTSTAKRWTRITLLFCTPIPIIAFYYLINLTQETSRSSSSYRPIDGKIYKTEEWSYTRNDKNYLRMYFVADTMEILKIGDKAFKKDSIWTYLSSNGDTMKIEYYKDGKLVYTK